MSLAPAGRFVWHDLLSTAVDDSLAFFTAVFAWSVHEREVADLGKYRVIRCGDRDIGGIVPLDRSYGLPSHWISYVTVDSVDEVVRRAPDLGAKVGVPGVDIPGIGRFALLQDPGGASFSALECAPGAPLPPAGRPPPGSFCWNELLTREPARAAEFYGEVCGWTARTADMGPSRPATIFRSGEVDAAGMLPVTAAAVERPAWLPYIAVTDVDGTVEAIGARQGFIRVPPETIPAVGRFAVATDPTGALFGVFCQERAV
jgi:predicted enzyme related to lactoylglutathione lyase